MIAAVVGVVGVGRMGAGIAQVFAAAGASVTIVERDPDAAAAARDRVATGLRRAAGRGQLGTPAGDVLSRVALSHDVAGLPADADLVVEAVADAAAIDRAMELGYRHPMGPLRSTDLVGVDVRLAIAEHLHRELGERFAPPALLREKVARGALGRKTGQGFYSWEAP